MKAIVPRLAGSILVAALAGACASSNSAAARKNQQQNYADIQKEMQAFEIRRQMEHNIRQAEDSLKMPGGVTALPEFR
ncbi:MAG TPA: hypothetical protein VGD88_15865 [Opitutaceae bacterium]